jgi:hypothetical protein
MFKDMDFGKLMQEAIAGEMGGADHAVDMPDFDALLGNLPFSIDQLLTLFEGDIVIALSDLKSGGYVPQPEIYAGLSIGNDELLSGLLDMGSIMGLFENRGDYYSADLDMPIHFAHRDGHVIASNNEDIVTGQGSGGNGKYMDKIKTHPFVLYLDIQRLIEKLDMIPNDIRGVVEGMDYIYCETSPMQGNTLSGECSLHLKDTDKNSINVVLEMVIALAEKMMGGMMGGF